MHHYSLRLLLVLLGAIALGWFAYLHWRREERHPVAIGLLALIVVPLLFLEYRAQAAEKRFSEAVSRVAHRDVSVRCQGRLGNLVDIGQELGTVWFDEEGEPADKTDIKRDACNWAKAYAGGDRRVTLNAALGVHVLAHEAIHLRGWTDEAVAECYGMQHSAQIARDLGASRMQAQRLAEFYWRVVYPDMPADYRTPDCAPGQRLDLHKDTPEWPSG